MKICATWGVMMGNDNGCGGRSFGRWAECIGHRIPDPVIIFMAFYPIAFLLVTVLLGGHAFETTGAGGEPVRYQILPMYECEVTAAERKGLEAAGWGLLVTMLAIGGLSLGPLGACAGADGARVLPFLNNIILLIALFFTIEGVFFGYASGSFTRVTDVVQAMVKQMQTMDYILVLTFFSYNFLGLPLGL